MNGKQNNNTIHKHSFKFLYSVILAVFIQSNINKTYSQQIIFGTVSDTLNAAIPNASIVLENNGNIETYTYSDEHGKYKMHVDFITNSSQLKFSGLGYKSKSIYFDTDSIGKKDRIEKNIVLIPKTISLNEVIIHNDKPIEMKKDTILFKVSAFTKGNEEVVEDLLKNIPGLTVDSEGTIKVGNKEIEKVMVEGDDFFEKGYKILTKNMPSNPIDKIELIENYSNNHLLKNIEQSEKVALNLKLKEDYKRVWFGNADLGYGIASENRYDVTVNLMNFGKKNKYYFLTNLNNTGFDATGNISHLIRPNSINEPASIGDNQNAVSLINLSASDLNFKKSRTNFNNAELASLNAIFNPNEKLKIKLLGFFNWDETNFYRATIDNVSVNGSNFTNTEIYKLRNKSKIAFGKLDLEYNISKTKKLKTITKYNIGNFDDGANVRFNNNPTIENLEHQNSLFDQKISYTNKFRDKKALLITGRYINETLPQDYTINEFYYQDLFPDFSNVTNVKQKASNNMQFVGLNAHLLSRNSNENLIEFQVGNEYRKDKLNTSFSLLEGENLIENPNGYQNQTTYQLNDLYFKGKYRYNISKLSLVGKIDLHQVFSRVNNKKFYTEQNPFFVNPSLGFDWKINDKNKISSTYSFNNTNAKVQDVYSDYVLMGFNSFSKGTTHFDVLQASSLILNYQLGNWGDRFFANTLLLYSKNHDFFSTNSLIDQNYTLSQKIFIKDRYLFTVASKMDYYFKIISTNLKLDLGYTKNNYKNSINNSNLREVKTDNIIYGLELRSGFKGFFNYHIGTKWTTTKIETTIKNSFTNNLSFLDLFFVFNKKFNVDIQTERYNFGNLQTNKVYYFLDFNAKYNVIKSKLTFGLTGKNLFNTKSFREFSISDIGNSTTEYRLLPRFILFNLKYRF